MFTAFVEKVNLEKNGSVRVTTHLVLASGFIFRV